MIRSQLRLEAQHACAVAQVLSSAAAPADDEREAEFQQSGVHYLTSVLGWFAEREARLEERVLARLTQADPLRAVLTAALASPGTSREALERLAQARAHPPARQGLAQFLTGPWSRRREALDAALASHRRVADWRAASGLLADGMLKERELYARIESWRTAAAAGA